MFIRRSDSWVSTYHRPSRWSAARLPVLATGVLLAAFVAFALLPQSAPVVEQPRPDPVPQEAAPPPAVAAPVSHAEVAPVPPHPVSDPMPTVVPTPLPAQIAERKPAVVPAPFVVDPTPLPPLATWDQTIHSTWLRGAPTDDATRFTELPTGQYVDILETRADWGLAAYGGDGNGRAPGTAWLKLADVASPQVAPHWGRNYLPTAVWDEPDVAAKKLDELPQWTWFELMGPVQSDKLLVRSLGDGTLHPPYQGWVDAKSITPARTLKPGELPRAFPLTLRPDTVRLMVPYRSQLDGSVYAGANCGPTTLAMALASLGINVSSAQLRSEVLDAQQLWGDDVGAFIDALARVADARGARVFDLYQAGSFKRWSVEDVRGQIKQGHPVIAQVAYQALPGRANALYDGDHYIVLTGLVGDRFLYNDAINSDGIGYDRIIDADQLAEAMNASDHDYAYTAFALGRR